MKLMRRRRLELGTRKTKRLRRGSDPCQASSSPRGDVGKQDPEGTWHGVLQPKVCVPLLPRCVTKPCKAICLPLPGCSIFSPSRVTYLQLGEGKGIRHWLCTTAPGFLSCYRKCPRNNWRLFRGSRATLLAWLLPSESTRDTQRFVQAHVRKRPSTSHFKSKSGKPTRQQNTHVTGPEPGGDLNAKSQVKQRSEPSQLPTEASATALSPSYLGGFIFWNSRHLIRLSSNNKSLP